MKGKILGLSLFAAATTMMVSCTNELNGPVQDPSASGALQLLKAPEVIAWSGNHILGNTYGTEKLPAMYETRSFELNFDGIPEFSGFDTTPDGGSPAFERWQGDRSWNKPNDIIEAERVYVIQYLQNNPNGGYKTLDIYNYIIQVVGNGGHLYDGDTPDYNGATHQVNASNEMNHCEIDGFFTQFNNTGMNSENVILIKNVKATNATYHDSYGNTWEDHYAFYFITFPDEEQYGYMAGKTGLYLCYDYETYKNSEGWGVTGDGIYDDWVIKLSPSNGSDIEIVYPKEDKCDKCDHPEHGDEYCDVPGCDDEHCTPCPDCGHKRHGKDCPEEDCDVPECNDEGNDIPVVGKTTSEVEVNLSILDEHDDYDIADLVTKLSIHVRAATDVKIVIPVPKANYCDVDDMYIFNEHYDGVYGGSESTPATNTISYEILPGHIVTLNITFNEDDITVWTDGIDEEVFEYCKVNFGDGINFEIYNYFNNLQLDDEGNPVIGDDGKFVSNGFDRSALQEYLNSSTIQFLGSEPDYYINAFNGLKEEGNGDYSINSGDCTVSITNSTNYPEEGTIDEHLNTGNFNKIFKRNDFEGPEGKHDHIFLWGVKEEAPSTPDVE